VANFSDNKKPALTVSNLLPEVNRSDVNGSVFSTAFDRLLTKDDSARVAGYIGQGNPNAVINRQIKEATPHRQAYQLAPTMVTTVGTETSALSFEAFNSQLELMGVDIDRYKKWGSTLQFNWVPPVNIDMLVNYSDYYWVPATRGDGQQYLTIESPCTKAQSAKQTFMAVVEARGSEFPLKSINYVENQFVIESQMADIFKTGFVFQTTNTSAVSLNNKDWTVDTSSYDFQTNLTTITVIEPISIVQNIAPVASFVGQWWYNTTDNQLYQWTGAAWVIVSKVQVADLSLAATIALFQKAANCACYGSEGWDTGPWDIDEWDSTSTCDIPLPSPWADQNRWVHKSQVQSSATAKRATLPILEYGSFVELNTWVQRDRQWKYRSSTLKTFAATDAAPTRFELEPIKGYAVANVNGQWNIYLFSKSQTVNRDIDHTATFVPGYKFAIKDDTGSAAIYTVLRSEYRELNGTDQAFINAVVGTGWMCTVVILEESTFSSAVQSGGINNIRIEPLKTSQGDTWNGYHAHWLLDVEATTTVATANHAPTVYGERDIEDPAVYSIPPVGFSPQVSVIAIGNTYQEFTANFAGITHIDLADKFKYDPANPTVYATPGSDELRLYINGQRQYLNYTEVVATGSPNYTVVGNAVQTSQTISYVTGIDLSVALNLNDVVRIEVGPAAYEDMGWYAVPVRTVEDEAAFIVATAAGTQPAYVSLTQYGLQEQQKVAINQYPQFNMYDVVTGEVVGASPLFAFQEGSDYPITPAIQRRIVKDATGKEFGFEQFLVDRSNNIMYAYRNTSVQLPYWFNTTDQKVYQWNNRAWTDQFLMELPSGAIVARTAVAAAIDPVELHDVDRALWYDTTNEKLFYRNVATTAWVEITGVTSASADPTLMTVWRHGKTDQQAVPQYVDKNRNPITVGSPDGSWGVVDQWMYNSEHKNYKDITYSQLVTHFSSIINAQPAVPGLPGNGAFTLLQSNYDYGLGGTIKEHNDSFDTLISAVNVTNVSPIGVIEFAAREYANSLLTLRDSFNKLLPSMLTTVTSSSLIDLTSYVADALIDNYENNDYTAQLYGDTSAYDPVTKKGVRNWIATAPMFGLTPLYRPHLNVDGNFVEVFNHDGHRTNISFSAAEQDRVARLVINATDNRTLNGKFGKTGSGSFVTTVPAFLTTYGSFRTNVYWYKVVSGTRTLYRFQPYAIIDNDPSFYDADGNELPDGIKYYNTVVKAVFEKTGLAWNQITVTGAEDIAPLWEVVDLQLLLGNLYLEIDQRLFEVTPIMREVFDYGSLVVDSQDQLLYESLNAQRFAAYVTENDIRTPFVNDTYNASNPFSWNYKRSISLLPPAALSVVPAASWQEQYSRWYNTPYPHLEPWKMQGYTDKPTWWDEEYKDTTGTRLWTAQMWTNLFGRIVPAGRLLPSGVVSVGSLDPTMTLYTYFSVDTTTDQLLPPYFSTSSTTDRSLFTDYANEIIAPDADYMFGDVGPDEWNWTISSQHPYDNAVIAFQMQPAKFLHAAFGPKFVEVDKLQVETIFKQVYSHEDAMFHGDIYDTNKSYYVRGLNQWYVNYNRYTGYDTNGEFRQLWAGWDPKMTHQFGGIIDTSSFEITNRNFELINSDYRIILANSGVVGDSWVDAFEVSLINIPPAIVQYNNQAAWRLEVDSLAAVPRTINYYGVKAYPFSANPATDDFKAFNYVIVGADSAAKRFYVSGDQTDTFNIGRNFTVSLSSTNNGVYTVTSSVYEPTTGRTRINVQQTLNSSTVDGEIDITDITLPWTTGDQIVLGSTMFLPSPLVPDTPYFYIKTGDRTFRLAETIGDAFADNHIDVISRGNGTHTVAQLDSSFFVFGGNGNSGERWYHYALDKNVVRTFTPPLAVLGMQSFINLMDGYASYQQDNHDVLFGQSEFGETDPDTGRPVDWAVETERFINWAYGLRQNRQFINDSYNVSVDDITNVLTFSDMVPMWRTGTMVGVRSTGTLPVPLLDGAPYYVVTTGTANQIRLSVSPNGADTSAWIDFTTAGSGNITIGLFDKQRAYPRFELNANRNNIYVKTPVGVIADVIEGPYSDIRIQQTIFDQYNRPLTANQIATYRQDERTRISVMPELENDIDIIYVGDPYNYIHIGGAHLFVEGYEHYLILNDYTVGGALLYDQFYGLWTKKFDVDYFEKEDYTLRPTLGGYYLVDGQFQRNIEGSVVDMSEYYDTNELSETTEIARYARNLLGYKGKEQYLNQLGVNAKSQFLFYKGMIQTKGSINSVTAYTNSRRFLDAKIDEFWAWKLADFGDRRVKTYPEVKLFASDGAFDDVRLEFLSSSDQKTDPEFVEDVNKGFQLVSFADDSRWNNFPEQRAEIRSPLFLDSQVSSTTAIYSGIAPPPAGAEDSIDYWVDTTNPAAPVAKAFNGNQWVATNELRIALFTVGSTSQLYVEHGTFSDTVRVLRRTLAVNEFDADVVTGPQRLRIAGDVSGNFSSGIAFTFVPLNEQVVVLTTASVNFDGTNTYVTTVEPFTFSATSGVANVRSFSDYTTEVINAGSGVDEFTKVNSESVRFNLAGFRDLMVIFTINPSKAKNNPAKLVDLKAGAVVQQMPLWHPALGYHSPTAIHNVTLQHGGDPARYQFTPNPLADNNSGNFWNQNEIGTVWLDTSYLGYVPYYDDVIYSDVNQRLYSWGRLAPWGDIRVYQWVESTVPPEQWDQAVIEQTNDPTIAQNDKATGTPYMITSKRTRTSYNASVINNTTIQGPAGVFATGDVVLFTSTGSLPSGLVTGTKYAIDTLTVGGAITLIDIATEEPIEVGSGATGQLSIVPAFEANDWVESVLTRDRMTAPVAVQQARQFAGTTGAINWPVTLPQSRFVWTPSDYTLWDPQVGSTFNAAPDVVDVYVNGVLTVTGRVVNVATTPSSTSQFYVATDAPLVLNEYDIIDVVRPVHTLTEEEAAFDPDSSDDGSLMVQWKRDYQYSVRTATTGSETAGYVTTTYYYFWVQHLTSRKTNVNASLSTLEIEQQLETIPTSYFVVQKPKDDPYLLEKYGYGIIPYGSVWSLGVLTEAAYEIPVQYRQAIIRKVASYLTDDNRFIARFTRDWTLRDSLTANGKQFNLKDKHSQWLMFRREQPGRVPAELWERLTESVVGYKVTNGTQVRVPAIDRELYDAQYGTDTRFGLGEDQAFVDRTYALDSIVSYLEDPSKDFWPLNIDSFFEDNNFDTPEGIRAAMDEIYATFPYEHVNGIWFETLSDAFATKAKYKELMKTSWIALHGVRILDVNGLFDD